MKAVAGAAVLLSLATAIAVGGFVLARMLSAVAHGESMNVSEVEKSPTPLRPGINWRVQQ
jgi:hypothetical protein